MQQFVCKAAEFGELAAAFAQHRKQYDTRFRVATANRADPEKHQPAGLVGHLRIPQTAARSQPLFNVR
jgi:hypothetical protein